MSHENPEGIDRRKRDLVKSAGGLMLAAAAALPASRLASHRAENRLQASNIAQNLLEDRRSRPFDELVVGKTESFTEVHGRITYQVSLKISTVSGVDSKYVKQARVEVDWKEKGGPQKLVYELRLFQQNR